MVLKFFSTKRPHRQLQQLLFKISSSSPQTVFSRACNHNLWPLHRLKCAGRQRSVRYDMQPNRSHHSVSHGWCTNARASIFLWFLAQSMRSSGRCDESKYSTGILTFFTAPIRPTVLPEGTLHWATGPPEATNTPATAFLLVWASREDRDRNRNMLWHSNVF